MHDKKSEADSTPPAIMTDAEIAEKSMPEVKKSAVDSGRLSALYEALGQPQDAQQWEIALCRLGIEISDGFSEIQLGEDGGPMVVPTLKKREEQKWAGERREFVSNLHGRDDITKLQIDSIIMCRNQLETLSDWEQDEMLRMELTPENLSTFHMYIAMAARAFIERGPNLGLVRDDRSLVEGQFRKLISVAGEGLPDNPLDREEHFNPSFEQLLEMLERSSSG